MQQLLENGVHRRDRSGSTRLVAELRPGTPVLYFTCEQAADAVYHPCGSACVCVVPAAVSVVLCPFIPVQN